MGSLTNDLRRNLSGPDTRWLTIGTLVGALVTLIGVALQVTSMVHSIAGTDPAALVSSWRWPLTTVGTAAVVLFAILLSQKNQQRR